MFRSFTKLLNPNSSLRFNIPLALRDKKYIIKDVRLNAIADNGRIRDIGNQLATILINEKRVLDNVIQGTETRNIASFNLRQEVNATDDIEIILNELTTPVVLYYNIFKVAVTFLIEEVKWQKK